MFSSSGCLASPLVVAVTLLLAITSVAGEGSTPATQLLPGGSSASVQPHVSHELSSHAAVEQIMKAMDGSHPHDKVASKDMILGHNRCKQRCEDQLRVEWDHMCGFLQESVAQGEKFSAFKDASMLDYAKKALSACEKDWRAHADTCEGRCAALRQSGELYTT